MPVLAVAMRAALGEGRDDEEVWITDDQERADAGFLALLAEAAERGFTAEG